MANDHGTARSLTRAEELEMADFLRDKTTLGIRIAEDHKSFAIFDVSKKGYVLFWAINKLFVTHKQNSTQMFWSKDIREALNEADRTLH